jgi:hypothetical protein
VIPWLTILLIALAGMFKAVADTLADHFDTSIFRKKDRRFWDKSVSWQFAPTIKFTKYHVDAWHIAGSLMIVCFLLAMEFHVRHFYWWAEVIGAGVLFNLSFNLFYNKILR